MASSNLQVLANAPIPTEFGTFNMHVFRWKADDLKNGLSPDHVALSLGDLKDADNVLVRIHSECLTSEVFGSLKCDCRKQLTTAQRTIAKTGKGVILYLRQEGRGIGLVNKIQAYKLQAAGHDTVDANRLLGLPDDSRDYAGAAEMIKHLGIKSVRLLTNNPLKLEALQTHGLDVKRLGIVCTTTPDATSYLKSKRDRMGHLLPGLLPIKD